MDHGGFTHDSISAGQGAHFKMPGDSFRICLNPLATAELASPNIAADHTLDTLTLRNEERAKMENGEPDFRVHADRRPSASASVRSSMSVGIVFCRSLAQLLTLFPCSRKTTHASLPHRF